MGLLDKTNPKATPKSALYWGVIGSLVTSPIFVLLHKPLRDYWPISLPVVFVFGGLIWALIEWQLDDNDPEEEPPPSTT
jgi:hypothetical protein